MKNPKRVERKRLRRAMACEQRQARQRRRDTTRWVFEKVVRNAYARMVECGFIDDV